MIDVLRWLLALPLLAISLFFILTNLRFLLLNFRVGLDAGPAPMTLIGGLAGSLGLLVLPYMTFADRLAVAWVPLVLDLGCLPFYLCMLALTLLQGLGVRLWKKHPDYVNGGMT